ncbi:MAG: TetR/AcrR family transcriptional regulator [Henriciella sp.]
MARTAMKPEQAESIRASLLDVAQELFEEGGIEAMSFRAIAARYGCSSMKAYSYFSSKADIIDALRIRAYRWLQSNLETAAGTAPDPREALKRITFAYLEAAKARPKMYELLFTHSGEKTETHPELIQAKVGALGVCQDAIEAVADLPDYHLIFEPNKSAHLFWIAAHGLVSLHAGGFLVVGYDAGEILPTLFETTLNGIFERRKS